MPQRDAIDALASLTLFADLSQPDLEAVAHRFEEQWFSDGQRILRQGFTGTGFHVILGGEATIVIEGTERARLVRGDFFGEISILLEEPPTADVLASGPLRCLVMGSPDLRGFLRDYPAVMYRMLQTVARRLHAASQWRN